MNLKISPKVKPYQLSLCLPLKKKQKNNMTIPKKFKPRKKLQKQKISKKTKKALILLIQAHPVIR